MVLPNFYEIPSFTLILYKPMFISNEKPSRVLNTVFPRYHYALAVVRPGESTMFPPNFEAKARSGVLETQSEKVIVAVKAEKVISKTALAWALTHVVRPGNCVTLLAVHSGERTGRKFWRFPRFTTDSRRVDQKKVRDQIIQICESCSQMVLQFHDQIEVVVRIKVVSGSPVGAVTTEAKSNSANWVVLDKKLKQERNHCMEVLRCNIVVIEGSKPKVLRLNLSNELQTPFFSASSSPDLDLEKYQGHKMKHSTPVSSPEEQSSSFTRSSEGNSLFLLYEQNPLFERFDKGKQTPNYDLDCIEERIINLSKKKKVVWIPQNPRINYGNTLGEDSEHEFSYSIREAVSLRRACSIPPPLCSICQNKAPVFGKPPKRFDYEELEEATNGFSATNFLAEGGFGSVHRGVLRNGLVVAVKQLKFSGSKGDSDFCREVRVLSCAQHRNVVLLVGFCIEVNKRVLVYEYICNGSLEYHLYGNKRIFLDWNSRLKIAIGTARGLRYLHEDCRVGCIIHRDMRPNNILLTHDFEPLVGDFGLVRLHTEWDTCEEERVVGSSGYLAPEYFDDGNVTEKVDIYAFGLVLLELITGRKTSELELYEGRSFLSEIFFTSKYLEPIHILAHKYQFLDPNLASCSHENFPNELQAMGQAATLCLNQEPEARPLMSKVLRLLERGEAIVPLNLDINAVGSRSGHMKVGSSKSRRELRSHSRKLSH